MIAKSLSTLRNAAIALSLVAGLGAAQDFKGTVQVDPRAGTATYDFHFQGPPRGYAVLFASPYIGNPWLLPGIGAFDLDPFRTFQLAVVPMGTTGNTKLRMTLPMPVVDRGICFQPLFVDTRFNLRLTPAWAFDALVGHQEMSGPSKYSGTWSRQGQRYTFKLDGVKNGDNISIAVNNRPAFAGRARSDGEFKGSFQHHNPFQPNTELRIYKNGKLWMRLKR